MARKRTTAALQRARRVRRELVFALRLRTLPPRVAAFQWRARRLAWRIGDEFSPVSATQPEKLAALLSLAKGRRRVVELGTATGWTAVSLLLADPSLVVVSYDVVARPELELYSKLVSPAVRCRLDLVTASGEEGPRGDEPVDLLYLDSSHDRQSTIREVHAWRRVLGDDALMVFDDFTHPGFPGVREAVTELGLEGVERCGLFVHRVAD